MGKALILQLQPCAVHNMKLKNVNFDIFPKKSIKFSVANFLVTFQIYIRCNLSTTKYQIMMKVQN